MNTRLRDLRPKHARLHAVHLLLRACLHRSVQRDCELVRLGSQLCGWWVPADAVRHGAVVYCAGAGEDISFDRELLVRGCKVTTFDPTPRAIAYVDSLALDSERFRFVPVGWWDESAELRFFIPKDDDPNLSVVNLSRSTKYVTAPVERVVDLMTKLGDDRVDIVKLDIEGAEYRVLADMLRAGPLPEVLCVEFDQPQPPTRTLAMVRRLHTVGYKLVRIECFNYTFTRPLQRA